MAISMFVWCEKNTSVYKDKETGRSRWVNNTAGPSKHVYTCLRDGCECERLNERMEELAREGEEGKGANGD